MTVEFYSESTQGVEVALRGGAERAPATQRISTLVPAARPSLRLIMAHSPHDSRGEEIRALRTQLLLGRESKDESEVLAILSPRAGEGRSQLAAELAIAFAQLGRRTLLVDADLRNPRQHDLFAVDNRLGLAHAIESGLAPQVYSVEGLPHLSLVTAGAICLNPLEVLLHRRFVSLVDEWRRTYEFVILDTSPVTPFSDALAVGHAAGRVLALTRADSTPYDDSRGMFRRLGATRAQIVGAVISHF